MWREADRCGREGARLRMHVAACLRMWVLLLLGIARATGPATPTVVASTGLAVGVAMPLVVVRVAVAAASTAMWVLLLVRRGSIKHVIGQSSSRVLQLVGGVLRLVLVLVLGRWCRVVGHAGEPHAAHGARAALHHLWVLRWCH